MSEYTINVIRCTECQTPIGYHWEEMKQPEKVLCYGCMEDIGIISSALNCKDLTTSDVYRAAEGPRSYEWQAGRQRLWTLHRRIWDAYVAKQTEILNAAKENT